MQHSFQRLAYNLQKIEADLLNSAVLIDSGVKMLASISLINQYQNKDHYNTYLLDEEKNCCWGGYSIQ